MQKVYLMKNALGLWKIGISNKPNTRAVAIANNSGVPTQLVHTWDVVDPAKVEKFLHKQYKQDRKCGEWFKFRKRASGIIFDISSRISSMEGIINQELQASQELKAEGEAKRRLTRIKIRQKDITPLPILFSPICTRVAVSRAEKLINSVGISKEIFSADPSLKFLDGELKRCVKTFTLPERQLLGEFCSTLACSVRYPESLFLTPPKVDADLLWSIKEGKKGAINTKRMDRGLLGWLTSVGAIFKTSGSV